MGGRLTKVDVETPSPCELLSEGSSHQRPCNRGNTVHGTNETKESRTPLHAHGMCKNNKCAGEDPRTPHTSDGASDNESHRSRRERTNQGSNLEDGEGNEQDPFDVEHGVELSEEQLERAGCQEVGGAVPADVVEVVELICDARDGYGDDLGGVSGGLSDSVWGMGGSRCCRGRRRRQPSLS